MSTSATATAKPFMYFTGTPTKPIVGLMILDGPTVTWIDTDGPGFACPTNANAKPLEAHVESLATLFLVWQPRILAVQALAGRSDILYAYHQLQLDFDAHQAHESASPAKEDTL